MRTLASIAFVAALGGCVAPDPTASPTLWDRLGGKPVVTQVVAETIDRASTDPRTARSFKDTKIQRIKDLIVEQICSLTGGGCKYTGDPMDKVHAGLKNTEGEMDLVVQFLRDALAHAGVKDTEKNELLRILAPMKHDIVTG